MEKVYRNIKLLDGTKDMVLQENMMIRVIDGIIVSIEEDKELKEANVVDLKGRYVIPGLINLHVHTPGSGFPKKKQQDNRKQAQLVLHNPIFNLVGRVLCSNAVKTELLSGTTTIRTVGGIGHIDSTIRDQVTLGKKIGPRILSSDMAVTIPGGHMEGSVAFGASSDKEFIDFIEDNVLNEVDWIKIMVTGGVLDAKVKGEPGEIKMSAAQIKLCCDIAHKNGLKVCAHVESPKGVKLALENGVDSIEHGASMDNETIELFKKNNSVLVSTISPAIPLSKFPDDVSQATEIVKYNTEVLLEGIISGTRMCLGNDVTVGLGTDTVCPFITHYDMWRELEYFHKLVGVSRSYALHTATLINASILGIENETGSIEVGKSADFIVLDNNPLDGFDAIRNPYMVHFMDKEFVNPKVKKNEICEKYLDQYLLELSRTM